MKNCTHTIIHASEDMSQTSRKMESKKNVKDLEKTLPVRKDPVEEKNEKHTQIKEYDEIREMIRN